MSGGSRLRASQAVILWELAKSHTPTSKMCIWIYTMTTLGGCFVEVDVSWLRNHVAMAPGCLQNLREGSRSSKLGSSRFRLDQRQLQESLQDTSLERPPLSWRCQGATITASTVSCSCLVCASGLRDEPPPHPKVAREPAGTFSPTCSVA